MFKGRLIIEVEGKAIDREIEIAEGEGLIFKVKNARIADLEKIAERISKFLRGEEKFLVISGGEIDIIKLTTTGQGQGPTA